MLSSSPRFVTPVDLILHKAQSEGVGWRTFDDTFRPSLRAFIAKATWNFCVSESDRDDVLQNTYVYLLDKTKPRYEPSRASASTYLGYAVQSAVYLTFPRRIRRERPARAPRVRDGKSWSPGTGAVDAYERYEAAEFVRYLAGGVDTRDLSLITRFADDLSIAKLAARDGVSRSTMSRVLAASIKRVAARACAALAV